MNKHLNNLGILKDFLEANNLESHKKIISFECKFEITTPKNFEIEFTEAIISFNNYNSKGELTLNYSELPVNLCPTTFRAKYNNFSIEDNTLIIEDTHPIIGKYEARITPV